MNRHRSGVWPALVVVFSFLLTACATTSMDEAAGKVGAWGVNLHDNDLVPIDASPSDRDRIVKDFKAACGRHGIVVPMATVNLFYAPVFRDGAFTANDARVRVLAS